MQSSVLDIQIVMMFEFQLEYAALLRDITMHLFFMMGDFVTRIPAVPNTVQWPGVGAMHSRATLYTITIHQPY